MCIILVICNQKPQTLFSQNGTARLNIGSLLKLSWTRDFQCRWRGLKPLGQFGCYSSTNTTGKPSNLAGYTSGTRFMLSYSDSIEIWRWWLLTRVSEPRGQFLIKWSSSLDSMPICLIGASIRRRIILFTSDDAFTYTRPNLKHRTARVIPEMHIAQWHWNANTPVTSVTSMGQNVHMIFNGLGWLTPPQPETEGKQQETVSVPSQATMTMTGDEKPAFGSIPHHYDSELEISGFSEITKTNVDCRWIERCIKNYSWFKVSQVICKC